MPNSVAKMPPNVTSKNTEMLSMCLQINHRPIGATGAVATAAVWAGQAFGGFGVYVFVY